jgi:hypothetical protein
MYDVLYYTLFRTILYAYSPPPPKKKIPLKRVSLKVNTNLREIRKLKLYNVVAFHSRKSSGRPLNTIQDKQYKPMSDFCRFGWEGAICIISKFCE